MYCCLYLVKGEEKAPCRGISVWALKAFGSPFLIALEDELIAASTKAHTPILRHDAPNKSPRQGG
jgi:hypothetical protein